MKTLISLLVALFIIMVSTAGFTHSGRTNSSG